MTLKTTQDLLTLRKQLKAKKPTFLRQDCHQRKKVNVGWRKPQGMHSKLRLKLKGHIKNVTPGYGSPRLVKGLHPSGLAQKTVVTLDDITSLNPETDGMIIAASVGKRKKVVLVKEAMQRGITILNLRDPQAFLTDIEQIQQKKREAKVVSQKEKETKQKEQERLAKEKEKKSIEEAVKTDDEKKEAMKKEMDKVLTKKDAEG
ncbi:50S ribosomal protein L32e [Candidatus Woesearchaeota archaeon]|nr:50S ribosomal protein L32e [Candidatus Woesearchaeota archaeon]